MINDNQSMVHVYVKDHRISWGCPFVCIFVSMIRTQDAKYWCAAQFCQRVVDGMIATNTWFDGLQTTLGLRHRSIFSRALATQDLPRVHISWDPLNWYFTFLGKLIGWLISLCIAWDHYLRKALSEEKERQIIASDDSPSCRLSVCHGLSWFVSRSLPPERVRFSSNSTILFEGVGAYVVYSILPYYWCSLVWKKICISFFMRPDLRFGLSCFPSVGGQRPAEVNHALNLEGPAAAVGLHTGTRYVVVVLLVAFRTGEMCFAHDLVYLGVIYGYFIPFLARYLVCYFVSIKWYKSWSQGSVADHLCQAFSLEGDGIYEIKTWNQKTTTYVQSKHVWIYPGTFIDFTLHRFQEVFHLHSKLRAMYWSHMGALPQVLLRAFWALDVPDTRSACAQATG